MEFKNELNEKQYLAVSTSSQYVRVVAGAGSGKTRVLTYRIAYLLDKEDYSPYEILAFTFTNKVAKEMKDRLIKLIGTDGSAVMIKTFHSFAAYFLRQEIHHLNFPSSFTILDEEDQLKLVKDLAFELGYKRSDEIVKKALKYIAKKKLEEKFPDEITLKFESFPGEKDCLKIYELYEEQKRKSYSLDFDDLLLYTNIILEQFVEVREKYRRRFSYILIDEFQDTNDIEYRMIRFLMSSETCLYVVGDPDQTIYTFRGANQDIILKLNTTFPMIQTIILDRNYRSTQNILDKANALIAHNKLRVKKDLYTNNEKGKDVLVKGFDSLESEARFVAKEIVRQNMEEGRSLSDMVILYRSNYVTLDFERALNHLHIPYRIYGGMKFYARREVKDILAYFHILSNKKDDISFERIINVPKRGIGDITISKIKAEAKEKDLSLYEYIESNDFDNSEVSKKNINCLKALVLRIGMLKEEINKDEEMFSKTLEDFISEIGYYDALLKEDDGSERIENVKALFQDLRSFLKEFPTATFDEYLQNITLMSAQDEVIDGDHVTLMTVHTAKGLEFPIVFLVRFNDSVFPAQRAILESGYTGLEEERRLAYVAFTRAKEELIITLANAFSYVIHSSLVPSMFIKEAKLNYRNDYKDYGFYKNPRRMNDYHFEDDNPFFEEKSKPKIEAPVFSEPIKTNGIDDWKVGDELEHTKLGHGVVKEVDGDGVIVVIFDEHGEKSMMSTHPAIKRINK